MTDDSPDDADATADSDDDAWTSAELDAAIREHLRKRKDAYVKMGVVDIPPDERG